MDPKLQRDQITALDDKTLVALVSEVLVIAGSNVEKIGFVSKPPERGSQTDMIV